MFFKKKNDNNIDNNDKNAIKTLKIITIITKKKNENLKTVLIKST